jgi:hypothetical protein
MNEFLEKQILPKLSHIEIKNPNRPITTTKRLKKK